MKVCTAYLITMFRSLESYFGMRGGVGWDGVGGCMFAEGEESLTCHNAQCKFNQLHLNHYISARSFIFNNIFSQVDNSGTSGEN